MMVIFAALLPLRRHSNSFKKSYAGFQERRIARGPAACNVVSGIPRYSWLKRMIAASGCWQIGNWRMGRAMSDRKSQWPSAWQPLSGQIPTFEMRTLQKRLRRSARGYLVHPFPFGTALKIISGENDES
jgi:hypothetical protein